MRVEAEPLRFAITRSGADKQRLAAEDVILVDGECRVAGGGEAAGRPPFRPSAEAAVHARLYAAPDCGCILHVHTVFKISSRGCFTGGGRRRFPAANC